MTALDQHYPEPGLDSIQQVGHHDQVPLFEDLQRERHVGDSAEPRRNIGKAGTAQANRRGPSVRRSRAQGRRSPTLSA